MQVINAILFAVVALFILVTVHEFGHFWVARKCGVRVLRFSIGFGKPFLRFRWMDAEFALAPIPLGGYVKMFGEGQQEEEVTPETEHESFSHKPVWQRMAIVSAGPVANFVLAIIFYWIVFLGGMTGYLPLIGAVEPDSSLSHAGLIAGPQSPPYEILSVDGKSTDTWREVFDHLMPRVGESGTIQLEVRHFDSGQLPVKLDLSITDWLGDAESPDFLGSLGISAYSPPLEPVFAEIIAGGAAEKAGLKSGDRVLSMDGIPVQSWEEWRNYLTARPDIDIALVILRNNENVFASIRPEATLENDEYVGRVGIMAAAPEWPADMKRDIHFSPFEAMAEGFRQTLSTSSLILGSLKKLVVGQISTKNLGGPISIAKYAGSSADAGWQSFLMFVAGLSVMLGVVNLLPIPVLDGGHLLFYLVEMVKGSPVNEWVQGIAMRFGMAVLFSVMILALYNDFGRL